MKECTWPTNGIKFATYQLAGGKTNLVALKLREMSCSGLAPTALIDLNWFPSHSLITFNRSFCVDQLSCRAFSFLLVLICGEISTKIIEFPSQRYLRSKKDMENMFRTKLGFEITLKRT